MVTDFIQRHSANFTASVCRAVAFYSVNSGQKLFTAAAAHDHFLRSNHSFLLFHYICIWHCSHLLGQYDVPQSI